MKRLKNNIIAILVLGLVAPATALGADGQTYHNRYNDPSFGGNIILQGAAFETNRLAGWLDRIAQVPQGLRTLRSIQASGHQLVIQHAQHAIISAGRTRAPMSRNLTNGVGESVHILFNARISDSGSHMVYNGKRELIEYTAVQNLYHELAHAMHMMKGTWRYFNSEKQAIEEENIFRQDLARIQGKSAHLRFRKSGVRISDMEKNEDNDAKSLPVSPDKDWADSTGITK
jgi:hypothetical protein